MQLAETHFKGDWTLYEIGELQRAVKLGGWIFVKADDGTCKGMHPNGPIIAEASSFDDLIAWLCDMAQGRNL